MGRAVDCRLVVVGVVVRRVVVVALVVVVVGTALVFCPVDINN